ncbi:peptide ABC transporter substrate-binding protein [Sporosarcina limicola]|uniref:Oligopeptide transport system substrate-binding protein n=1 Tax=Sporosarcina limicola TaxID=34101 RepID=A0A927MET2_9BACL|nr:peptide ABC transporter substrate-binding protein [Sporosarcina limicola]MBE1553328.1 oligopeptide transport system substrate-binding protein [Sporosarcina limicola]
MNLRKIWLFTLIFSSLLLVAGCYGGEEKPEKVGETEKPGESGEKKEEAATPKVLHLAVGGEIPTMKTTGSMDGLSQTIIQNVFEGLYRLGQDDKPIEGLVETSDVSEDGKKYVFKLRQNAKWSNGEPTTAHDFVYAWKKALHPDTISPHAYLMDSVKNASNIQNAEDALYGKVDELGIKATDDYTLEVELDNSVPYFIELLTNPVFYPQNEKYVESQKEEYALEPENLIFNGPFVLDSWQHDQKWLLKKNESYWDAANVKVEEIDFKVAKDTATVVNLYETDTIDVASLSSEFVDVYSGDAEYVTSMNSEIYFLRFNQRNDDLKNVNIRKALDMGWDKEAATDSILKNGSIPAYFLIYDNFVTLEDKSDFRDRFGDFNNEGIEKAQEYWKKGLAELGKDSIKFELLSYDDGQRKSVAEYIKNQLEKNLPGLEIGINQQPNKQKIAIEDKQEYDISYSGWRNDVSDPVEFLSIFLSDGPYNWQDFKNEKYDELVNKAMTDFSDTNQRYVDLQDAEKILIGDEAAISPLHQSGTAKLVKPHVKGLAAHSNSTSTYKWVTID